MNWKSEEPCMVCGFNDEDSVCYHHIYSRKAYPEFQYEKWNNLPLCTLHHNKSHENFNKLVKENMRLELWLIKHDWYFDEIKKAWKHGTVN